MSSPVFWLLYFTTYYEISFLFESVVNHFNCNIYYIRIRLHSHSSTTKKKLFYLRLSLRLSFWKKKHTLSLFSYWYLRRSHKNLFYINNSAIWSLRVGCIYERITFTLFIIKSRKFEKYINRQPKNWQVSYKGTTKTSHQSLLHIWKKDLKKTTIILQ